MTLRTYSLLFILLLSFQAQALTNIERYWSRSTLQAPHLHFRHFNRMPPIITKDLVIQGNAVDGIKAFSRQSGNQVWSRKFKNGVEGGAATSGNRLFFGANNGQFYCVNIKTGETIWQYPLNSESLTAPLVRGTYVYHMTGNNSVYAFDAESGRTVWVKTRGLKAPMTVRGLTQPFFDNGRLYVGFSDGFFSALNAENGRELWTKRIGDDKKFNDIDASARATDKCIIVASYANALYCLDKQSGSILWRHDVGGFNPALIVEDKIYYPTLGREIHILDAGSGKLLKKVLLGRNLATEIIHHKGKLIYGESQGALVIRDKNSLQVYDRFYPGRGLVARPTVDRENNDVYLLSNEANLFKIRLKASAGDGFPWSKKL